MLLKEGKVSGDIEALWLDAVADTRKLQNTIRHQAGSSQCKWNIQKAKWAAQDGHYHKAIQAFSSRGLADTSPEVLQEMQSKHPQFLTRGPSPTYCRVGRSVGPLLCLLLSQGLCPGTFWRTPEPPQGGRLLPISRPGIMFPLL